MIVVSDTSPLNYLVLIGHIEILPVLFERVVAPPAVLRELCQSGAPLDVIDWSSSPPSWLEVVTPTVVRDISQLGLGEVEAISLAQEMNADRLLVDERKASLVARQLGLTITGTLGVLSLAANKGLLDLAFAISSLRQTNFREPVNIVEELLAEYQTRRGGPK
jgi:predicted nucleic acid-binding protein